MMERPTVSELNLLHASVCQALGDPKRLMILYALDERPRHVSALAADLGMPQPTVSRHLQILRERHIVKSQREGAKVVYSIAEPRVIGVMDTMRQILRDSVSKQSEALIVGPS